MNSIAIARHAELRALAYKLQAQDLAQESLLVEIQKLFYLIFEVSQDDTVRTLARTGIDRALKAQDCEKQDVNDHRKLGDLLDIKLHAERKEDGR